MSTVDFAVLVGVLGYVIFWWLSVAKAEKGVVNTIGLPLIDNLLDFLPNKLLESLEVYRKKYGNLYLIRIVSKRIFVISEPTLGKEVLMKRPKQFRRSRGMEYAGNLMGVSLGLLHSSGAIWSKMRRATAPSFNQMNVTAKLDAIQNELQAWMKRIRSQAQSKQVILDMFPEAFSLTIRVLSRAAFGLGPEDAVGKYFFSPTFITDMKHMLQFTVQHGFMRLPTWLWKISPFYKYEVVAVEANQRLSGHCQNVIDYKRAQCNNHEGHAMIDTLIQKHGKEIQDGGLTDEEVIHNVKIFYVAGTDTTGNLLYLLYIYF
ncbi:cytochrome P450 [archaeon]|nr:MAG: cytochrome P450 [archaeon]